MNRNLRGLRLPAAAVLAGIALVAGGAALGLRWNSTPSYPIGLWRLVSTTWARGDLVFVDVPEGRAIFRDARERGYLRRGLTRSGCAPLLKRIVAVAGDTVTISGGVSVNGRRWPNSGLLRTDPVGRPLRSEARSGIVPAGFVWVMSEHTELSFDSRYFGALPAALVRGRAEPLWTW